MRRLSQLVLVGLTVTIVAESASLAAIRRVDPDSTATNPNGSSWPTAYASLDDALADAEENDILWLGDGEYKSTVRTDPNDARSATFLMRERVQLVGGFQGLSRSGGGETQQSQRDPEAYPSILSGDIDNDNVLDEDNAYHVVTASGSDIDHDSRLNGLTIRDGYAFSDVMVPDGGGGLHIFNDAKPVIIRCKFISNSSQGEGGAVCVARPNVTWTEGPEFLNCVFINNSSLPHGGNIVIHGEPELPSMITLVNCLGYGNSSASGAFFHSHTVKSTLINCTATGNYSGVQGAVEVLISPPGSLVSNCNFWGNTNAFGDSEMAQLYLGGTPNVTVKNTNIQNLDEFAGNGNIDSNPRFVNPSDGNYRLQCGTLAIDAGDDSDVPYDIYDIDDNGYTTTQKLPDLSLSTRIVNAHADLGSYELSVDYCLSDVNDSGTVKVDDFLAVINGWGCTSPPSTCPADIAGSFCGGDGTVNVDDLLAIINGWGYVCATGLRNDVGSFATVQDCADACALEYTPHTTNWYDCVDKCIEGLCEAELIECDE